MQLAFEFNIYSQNWEFVLFSPEKQLSQEIDGNSSAREVFIAIQKAMEKFNVSS